MRHTSGTAAALSTGAAALRPESGILQRPGANATAPRPP
ncbi:hypothetical protein FM106_08385 [Brachybacterium faecium]|nr:hypothetical protein FM106_08385 [Brachybacterium faecium]